MSDGEGLQACRRTLEKLARHDISGWALAGGLAVELHWKFHGREPVPRPFNDIDFVTASFDRIPTTLAQDFLFRHVHPSDPPGKMMLQFVDPESCVRVDVFRAYGNTMERVQVVEALRVISVEDVVARAARLLLDLAADMPVAAKHAADYLRLRELTDPAALEAAWQDHRKLSQPLTFRETDGIVERLIEARSELLISPEYSTYASEVCPRCDGTTAFPLSEPKIFLEILGYC